MKRPAKKNVGTETRSSTSRLWRYNFAILIGGGYWILVLPIAASQVVTLWMMALSTDFSQGMAISISELMTPVLGAFLAAHSLAPEYRSGVGSVLACKPVSLHRVVTLRVALALLTALALTTVTLTVCSVGLQPIDIPPALLVAIPPLWFLSLLALTAATLFRSALGGFAVAAAIWALDLGMGYGVNPFFSSQGYRALLDKAPMSDYWLVGKGVLLASGLVLLLLHHRMMGRLSRAPERRDVTRLAVTAASVAIGYCLVGAAANLNYAMSHRGRLLGGDVRWLRQQLSAYGPLPVARLFGPAFAAYVESPPVAKAEDSVQQIRVHQLEQALQRWPGSIWADCIAFELGREQEVADPAAATEAFFLVADRYSKSPLAPQALTRIFRSGEVAILPLTRLTAARRVLSDHSSAPEAERAAEYVLDQDQKTVKNEERRRAAEIAVKVAPTMREPYWYRNLAEELGKEGRVSEAITAAREAVRLGRAIRERAMGNPELEAEFTPNQVIVDRSVAEAEQLLKQWGQ